MNTPETDFDFSVDPFTQFNKYFSTIEKQIAKDPNAMSLATVGKDGFPSVRTVLFKGLVRNGFSFYTNYHSHKSQDLQLNSKASLLFYWPTTDQQVRVSGLVEKLTEQESDAYFASRARISQIGAWASQQSEKVSGVEELAQAVAEYEKKYPNQVPRPPHWGGYVVKPLQIEFWFARQGRLHERYIYEKQSLEDKSWKTYMKFP